MNWFVYFDVLEGGLWVPIIRVLFDCPREQALARARSVASRHVHRAAARRRSQVAGRRLQIALAPEVLLPKDDPRQWRRQQSKPMGERLGVLPVRLVERTA